MIFSTNQSNGRLNNNFTNLKCLAIIQLRCILVFWLL
nr:MAG TPA: hypothetical protein [Caudoviricetes sp.]